MSNYRYLLKLFVVLFLAILFHSYYLNAQGITKATIKKPVTIVGCWKPAYEVIDNKHIPIKTNIFYNFLPNGTFQILQEYQEKNDTWPDVYFVKQIGKWELSNDKSALILKDYVYKNWKKQKLDLADIQQFLQDNYDAFSIKKMSGKEVSEYIFIRDISQKSVNIGPTIFTEK